MTGGENGEKRANRETLPCLCSQHPSCPFFSGARFPNLLQVPDALQGSGDAQGLSANSEGEAGFEGALQGAYANM